VKHSAFTFPIAKSLGWERLRRARITCIGTIEFRNGKHDSERARPGATIATSSRSTGTVEAAHLTNPWRPSHRTGVAGRAPSLEFRLALLHAPEKRPSIRYNGKALQPAGIFLLVLPSLHNVVCARYDVMEYAYKLSAVVHGCV